MMKRLRAEKEDVELLKLLKYLRYPKDLKYCSAKREDIFYI